MLYICWNGILSTAGTTVKKLQLNMLVMGKWPWQWLKVIEDGATW